MLAPAKNRPGPKKKGAIPVTKWEKWRADPESAVDNLCDRIVNGEGLRGVARDLGCDIATLHAWINADSQRSARVKDARTRSAVAYDEMALQGIEEAADPFELSKAKERAHHLRWRASKINPREYGEKVAVGGADDLPPIKQKFSMTDAELLAIAARGRK